MSNLTGKAASAYDNINSIAASLQTLLTNINNGLSALAAANATDTLAKVQALKDALAPVQQAIFDASDSYTEAGNINNT